MKIDCSYPASVRLWRWWCEHGWKNRSGGTLGGSFLMRRLQSYCSLFHGGERPVGRVYIDGVSVLFVDSLGLRTHNTALPQLRRIDTELLLAKLLTPNGGVFVDIGANVGVLSLLALSETVAAVHSFEPNPAMMALLRKTRSANPLGERWYLNECAVGASKSQLKLYVDARYSGTASLVETWQQSDKLPVDVTITTLDHWCSTASVASVDVVKMDVEGWESKVLEGARHTPRTFYPYIWFEHNLPALRRSGPEPRRVLDSLQDLGYVFFLTLAACRIIRPWFAARWMRP